MKRVRRVPSSLNKLLATIQTLHGVTEPTFFTPSLISQIDDPASRPGIRSPMVKGKETPVELRTVVVIDLR